MLIRGGETGSPFRDVVTAIEHAARCDLFGRRGPLQRANNLAGSEPGPREPRTRPELARRRRQVGLDLLCSQDNATHRASPARARSSPRRGSPGERLHAGVRVRSAVPPRPTAHGEPRDPVRSTALRVLVRRSCRIIRALTRTTAAVGRGNRVPERDSPPHGHVRASMR